MRRVWFLIVGVFLGFGCEKWESSGPERLRDAYPTQCGGDAEQQTPDAQNVPAQPSDFASGTWFAKVTQVGTIAIPGYCEACVLTLTDFAIVMIPPDGSFALWRFCGQAMTVDTTPNDQTDPPDPNAPRSVVPDALVEANILALAVLEEPALKTLPDHEVVWLWGVRNLSAGEPLPESKDSPKVFDQDNDGKPGVTVLVTAPIQGERYMVRRAVWQLKGGPVVDGLWIKGTLTFSIEEKAVGADPAILATVAPITPRQNANTYVMRRVPGDFTCKEARAIADALFADAPVTP